VVACVCCRGSTYRGVPGLSRGTKPRNPRDRPVTSESVNRLPGTFAPGILRGSRMGSGKVPSRDVGRPVGRVCGRWVAHPSCVSPQPLDSFKPCHRPE